MNNMRTKQFQILTDINLVWDFLTDIYDRENGSGVAAPFFEHAILASWMDNSYSFLNRFWFDGERTVAFVFYSGSGNVPPSRFFRYGSALCLQPGSGYDKPFRMRRAALQPRAG